MPPLPWPGVSPALWPCPCLALPLFYASRHIEWLLPALLGYALAGSLPVLLTRPLWWSRRWAAVEQALPLPVATIHRSDRALALWLMLPWHALLVLGSTGLWWTASPALQASANWALGGLILAALCSLRLSLASMQGVRRRTRGRALLTAVEPIQSRPPSSLKAPSVTGPALVQPSSWASASIVLAMRHGNARGTARILAASSVATISCGLGTLSSSIDIGVPLAFLAILSLTATGYLRARSEQDLLPLQLASLNLPVAQGRWVRARRLLPLMPVTVGMLSALPGTLATPGLRPLAPLFYVLVLGLGCAWEAARAEKPSHRTGRWLLTLALALAISSEMTSPCPPSPPRRPLSSWSASWPSTIPAARCSRTGSIASRRA